MGYCRVGLMSGLVNVRSGYCPVGRITGSSNVYRASAVRSGYSPVELLSGQASVLRVSVHRATVCRGRALGKVSGRIVSGYHMTQHVRFNITRTNQRNFLLKFLSHFSGMKNRNFGFNFL